MPIPILIGAAAAATFTFTEIVAIIAGSTAGGAALGAGSWWLIFRKPSTKTSEAHNLTEAHKTAFKDTNAKINGLKKELEEIQKTVETTTTAITTSATESLQAATSKNVEMTKALLQATQKMAETSHHLTQFIQQLNEILANAQQGDNDTIIKLHELNKTIDEKTEALSGANAHIKALQTVLDTQAKSIEKLTKEITGLREENTDLKTTVKDLEEVAEHTYQNLLFFKHAAMEKNDPTSKLSVQPQTAA